ncbi:MAG: chromate efflux transporter [Planctomycetes bacterium]|nr:chromate efflux transporter [Planctomycetota bacterium]
MEDSAERSLGPRPGHSPRFGPEPPSPTASPLRCAARRLRSVELLRILGTTLKLGCTSFGGPVAHVGYFRAEYVERQRWLDEHEFADLVALCQFLPGPASSQIGYAIGLKRGGWVGGLIAWLGFTLPSVALLVLFAYGLENSAVLADAGLLQGMKAAAVAVVAHAIWGMASKLCRAPSTIAIAVATAVGLALFPSAWSQVLAIVTAAILGAVLLESSGPGAGGDPHIRVPGSRVALVGFFAMLVGLPFLAAAVDSNALRYFDGFYRSGSLVFGGGHVVLPLLEDEVVGRGWLGHDVFLAGYGAAQAVPGPLFTFAGFLGASMEQPPNGIAGAAICTLGIFCPTFLLVAGALPLWSRLRRYDVARRALRGTNAAVVGLLAAAFYDPVLPAGIVDPTSAVIAIAALAALVSKRVPVWSIVLLAAMAGWIA